MEGGTASAKAGTTGRLQAPDAIITARQWTSPRLDVTW
jgi:hypothetical protein